MDTDSTAMPTELGMDKPFRFYDNRQKYLMFVTTCTEKWVIADRVSMEISHLRPKPPALRVFDGGTGDGTVLARVMRDLHRSFPTVPFVVVAKEISLEDVRQCLEKVPDRLAEHPSTVVVLTNLIYGDAPRLMPSGEGALESLNWHEIGLSGNSACDFDEQIKGLSGVLADGWQVSISEKTGNPTYVKPTVLVLYREDHRFALDRAIPQKGDTQPGYDLLIASQPFRARASAERKVKNVLAPLAKCLAPGGRMLTTYSIGDDPGLELVRRLWPDENPFLTNRHLLIKELKAQLTGTEPDLVFDALPDNRSRFKYHMHNLPADMGGGIGTSSVMAAWNAAVYVAQIEDERLLPPMESGEYVRATQETLSKHGGLWFQDESFIVSRRP
jgi:hypothetical protein